MQKQTLICSPVSMILLILLITISTVKRNCVSKFVIARTSGIFDQCSYYNFKKLRPSSMFHLLIFVIEKMCSSTVTTGQLGITTVLTFLVHIRCPPVFFLLNLNSSEYCHLQEALGKEHNTSSVRIITALLNNIFNEFEVM